MCNGQGVKREWGDTPSPILLHSLITPLSLLLHSITRFQPRSRPCSPPGSRPVHAPFPPGSIPVPAAPFTPGSSPVHVLFTPRSGPLRSPVSAPFTQRTVFVFVFSGDAGGGNADRWRLLQNRVGATGHGLPDPWSLLWKRHLSFFGVHEASVHLGHAAGAGRFQEGTLRLKQSQMKSMERDQSYQAGARSLALNVL